MCRVHTSLSLHSSLTALLVRHVRGSYCSCGVRPLSPGCANHLVGAGPQCRPSPPLAQAPCTSLACLSKRETRGLGLSFLSHGADLQGRGSGQERSSATAPVHRPPGLL